MSRSKTLFQVQQYDSQIDNVSKRINEINEILSDNKLLEEALKHQSSLETVLLEKRKALSTAEVAVQDHSLKIEQNQKKLYSGSITNPKDLQDLQLESESLNKYLQVLEERQLEAMLAMEEAQKGFDAALSKTAEIESSMAAENIELVAEKEVLEGNIRDSSAKKDTFLSANDIPDLPTYESIRNSSGGIGVTLMVSNSCSACGASIPSAIAQEARSPGKLAFCPTCKRILHPG